MKWLIEIVEEIMGHPGSMVDSWRRGRRFLSGRPKPLIVRFARVVKLSPLGKKFAINVLIGLVIQIPLFVFHDVPKLQSLRNSIFDMMMMAYEDLPLHGASSRVPIRIVDIDDATYRDFRWGAGEPLIAPRPELAAVIVAALQTGANEVVVDITLDNRVGPEERQLVRDVIESRRDSSARQHLLLVRGLRLPLRDQYATARAGRMAPPLSTVRSAAWDGVRPLPGLQIHDVVPNFVVSSDHVLREWMLWQIACTERTNEPAQMVAYPSVQLELLAIRKGVADNAIPWNKPREITEERNGLRVPCIWADNDARELERELQQWVAANLGLRLRDNALANRIMYSIPWLGEYASPIIHSNILGPPTPLFVSYSAQQLLGPDAMGGAAKALPPMPGSVLLVGQTFSDSRDFYDTPIGNMPGVMVLANAIDTIFAYGVVSEPPLIWRFALSMVAICLVAFMFAKWPRSRVANRAFAIMFVLLLPATVILFRSGVWLDVAIPLVAIRIHVAIEARRNAPSEAAGF